MTPVRGPALLSALDGRLPRGDRDIMLGVATMRATGARVGGTVRVTVADPDGKPHVASFRVIGRASLNAGTGGLGNGAVMTTSAFVSAQCPAGPQAVRLPAFGQERPRDRGAGPGGPGSRRERGAGPAHRQVPHASRTCQPSRPCWSTSVSR